MKEEQNDLSHQDVNNMNHYIFDPDPTPKASAGMNYRFRFTPSFLDPNSSPFANFANQPPGFYTPTPGASTLDFQPHEMAVTHTFDNPDPLTQPNPSSMTTSHSLYHQPLDGLDHHYAAFRHPFQTVSYQNLSLPGSVVGGVISESSSSNGTPGAACLDPKDSELDLGSEMRGSFMHPSMIQPYTKYAPKKLTRSSPSSFRFDTTLHAATAMLRSPSDIPVTYLNKRQVYTISVVDTAPSARNHDLKRYRTTVRIAFDEEEQRRTAQSCWRLWKDGRGTVESGGNPDRLRAIDYEPLETRAVNEKKGNNETELQIDEASASFDRFTIIWSSTSPEPSVYFCLRFLFLSTDFSHSKGVKGVPVRLVGKTEYIGDNDSRVRRVNASELAYCKIKLFRDKGAERKLANDRLHVEQALQKLDHQIQQLENDDIGNSSSSNSHKKKKRNNSVASDASPQQRRHRRDWSISSTSSNPRTQREELARKQEKRASILSMPASIQPVSKFSLVGDPADDPSLPFSSIAPQSQWEAPGVNIPIVTEEQPSKVTSALRRSPTLSQISSLSASASEHSPVVQPMTPPEPMFVPGRKLRVHTVTRDVDAMDVDPFYVPQPHPTIRPALCVYVIWAKIGPNGDAHTMHLPTAIDNDVYYAVYVPARTASSLTAAIASKFGIDPASIRRTTIVNKSGLRLALDDDVTREMLENQDMRIAIREIERQSPKHADNMAVDKQSAHELILAY